LKFEKRRFSVEMCDSLFAVAELKIHIKKKHKEYPKNEE